MNVRARSVSDGLRASAGRDGSGNSLRPGPSASVRPGPSGALRPGPAARFRVVLKNPEHCIAVWDRTVLEIWRGPATIGGVKRMMATCEELLSDGKGDVNVFIILEKTSPPPGQTVRPLLAQWSREIIPKMASAIVVTEGGAFRASLVRGVCTALTLLTPHRIPFKFVASVDEGVKLRLSTTSTIVRRAELTTALAELRALLE